MKSNINIEQLGKINEKLKLYIKDEELEIADIKSILNSINYNYDTDNAKKIEEVQLELTNKLKIINKNHNTDIFIIEKNIDLYKEINKNTEKIFKDLTEK